MFNFFERKLYVYISTKYACDIKFCEKWIFYFASVNRQILILKIHFLADITFFYANQIKSHISQYFSTGTENRICNNFFQFILIFTSMLFKNGGRYHHIHMCIFSEGLAKDSEILHNF